MPPILTPEQWQKQKAAYEAFNRWEETQRDFPDIPTAAAFWSDMLRMYQRLHPDDPSVDPEKYEHLARIRQALSVLR